MPRRGEVAACYNGAAVNIYLIPYTAWRHLVLGFLLGGLALSVWWAVLWMVVVGVPFLYETIGLIWKQYMEGPLFIGSVAVSLSMASLLVEGSLRRRAFRWRFGLTAAAGAITGFGFLLSYPIIQYTLPLFTGAIGDLLIADSNLVTLRYRILLWLSGGFWSGVGPLVVRRLHHRFALRFKRGRDADFVPPLPTWFEWFDIVVAHIGGAVVAASLGAAAWHLPGHDSRIAGDLYLASALGPMVWGFLYGALTWSIPDDLYVGWIRVLSAERYGQRIPIPHPDGSPSERFLGHFPRGLDLYLPAEQGVAELHVSFIVDARSRYAVRGLSVEPTLVKRFLERVDLRYDVRRPAPLETQLGMEDRILLGDKGQTVVEFVMLPKEER